ncbi:MAG: hypothetical protein IT433_09945 [Phycisphaerales bacterium]|nr:hypothetical protein [Phycisphaerales bacterium]
MNTDNAPAEAASLPQSSCTGGATTTAIGLALVTSISTPQSPHRAISPYNGARANPTCAAHSGHSVDITCVVTACSFHP